ncbi:MAG: alanine racemase [Enterobacter kobei]|nr:alanine racemase [Enterobacter kobei]
MSRPVQATIDTRALRHNLHIVRQAAPVSRVWSVVKANAYGHGIERVWNALSSTDGFAMLNLEEAILLRERGWKGPILMLEGFFHADELALFDQYRLTTSVHSNWQLKALQNARIQAPLDLYLKVNSGMNRLGFQPERVHSVWQQLRAMSNVGSMTLMSHFAVAERPDGIDEAMVKIEQAAEGLDCPRSLANSAATLWHPTAHFDWVRPGIILYGASPSGQWQDVATSGRPETGDDAQQPDHRHSDVKSGRLRGLRTALPGARRATHRYCRLRLWRWLSARGAGRHAGAGGWCTHPHGGHGVHGYAGGGSDPVSAGWHWYTGGAVGAGN